jgi:hypothetical protein
MAIQHKKKFGIYHWDTFDNVTILIDEADTLKKAEGKVKKHYKGRLGPNGADKVDIVDLKGNVVRSYHVG